MIFTFEHFLHSFLFQLLGSYSESKKSFINLKFFKLPLIKILLETTDPRTTSSDLSFFIIVTICFFLLNRRATQIPVGKDQTQHLQIANALVRFFNNKYGETFPYPRPIFNSKSMN